MSELNGVCSLRLPIRNTKDPFKVANLLPISAIVPTRNRSVVIARMFNSLAQQSHQPAEMVVVDASQDNLTEEVCRGLISGLDTKILYQRARQVGAAVQRNEAAEYASQYALLFLDDDILFEPDCLIRLWDALQSDDGIGGANAMITNQQYLRPGLLSRSLFRILHGRYEESYAGKCIGPAMNLLPEDQDGLPEIVPVEWLNLGCTIYRRQALPSPVFHGHFEGYSLMEDLALSLVVGKKWKLANARTARIYHDSQPADYKADQTAIAKMELTNRHFIMTRILGRRSAVDYLKLALLQAFGITTALASPGAWRGLPLVLLGKAFAIQSIIRHPGGNARKAMLASEANSTVSNEAIK